jgi:MFS family permease
MTSANAIARRSVWAPLGRSAAFRALYIASAVAWVGGFMQDVAGAWLMTSLAPSPIMVALLQTAMNLPFFLLSLPAGALSDIVDKRIILFGSQTWIMLVVLSLGALTLSGAMTAWLLLTLILLVGIGVVLNSPAWNSLMPDLVADDEVESAVALTAAGFNMMRGIGAALGGLLVGVIGAGNVFLLNALSMVGVLFVLVRLKPPKAVRTAPPEKVIGAMKAGMRYLKHSVPLHAVLARTALFVGFSSCFWALLPLLAREGLGLNAAQYGLMISVFGVGNVVGAAAVPRMRQTLSQDLVLSLGTLFVASCIGMLAFVHSFPLACVAMFGGGIGWITACAALNASLLSAAPLWVRARIMSIYLLVFNGAIAGGAIVWGFVAQGLGMDLALKMGSIGLVISLASIWLYPLKAAEEADVRAAEPMSPPDLPLQPHPEHGPVLISVEYMIDPDRGNEFNGVVAALEVKRRRDGAYDWHLYSDLARPGHFIEMYRMETWGEYLRQLERSVAPDSAIEQRVYDMHIGDAPPQVTHLISERRRSRAAKTKQYAKIFEVKRGGPGGEMQ